MEKTELCRLCALQKDNLLFIYSGEGLRLSIELKIIKCLSIQLNENYYLPKTVCLECCAKLDAFNEFLENSRKAQKTLRSLFPDKPALNGNSLSQEDCKDIGSLGDDFETSFQDPQTSDAKSNNDNNDFVQTGLHHESTTQEPGEEVGVGGGVVEDDAGTSKDWAPHTWLCSDCSEELSSVDELRSHHGSVHKQEPRYLCGSCSKVFLVYSGFITHLKRHRNQAKYTCQECGKGFSNKKMLETHRVCHRDVRPFVCEECGKSFRQQSALCVHNRCHLPDNLKNKFPCTLCNKRFSTKPNLVAHMRIHSGVRNFTCDQCGKSFIQKGNLDAHLLTHSHDKPFSCQLCSKRFKTVLQLRKHHSVHTGAKPHQCDVCGRTFREKGTLREHHRIHTGAMPFTCEFCGKSFRFKGILTTHRRQHTGERPYSCAECQHHFTNWPNYNKHMKRRHGINTSRNTRGGGLGGPELGGGGLGGPELGGGPPGGELSHYMYGVYGLPQLPPLDPLAI